MTTREQLGLNANWIPMDSSTGSSDSFQGQIDSLKQIVKSNSDKLNELSSGGTSESFLDYTEDKADIKFEILSSNDGGRKLVISTDSAGVDFRFNIGYDSTVTNVLLNANSSFEIKIPEVMIESLKEFNAHLYRKTVTISDLKMRKSKTYYGVKWKIITENVGTYPIVLGNYSPSFSSSSGEQNFNDLNSQFNLYLFSLVCSEKEYKSISTSSQIYLNSNTVKSIRQVFSDAYSLPSNADSGQIIAIKTLNNSDVSSITAFSKYVDDNGLKTESGLKSFKILEFNQVFDSNESEMFRVHDFKVIIKTVNDIINPVLVSDKVMKKYGTRLDQTGHPIYVYGRTHGYSDSVVYAYFTDLSRWLLYSYYDGGGFMRNVNKLSPRHRSESPRPFIMGDGVISNHEYTANISQDGDISYRSLNFNQYKDGENPRIPVGATLEELKSGKVIESYVLIFNSEVKSKFQEEGIYSVYNMLRDYIDASTGEYLTSTRLSDNIKQAKLCVKQTVKWDNDTQKVIATGEKVTLRDMFVNLADKSNKYISKFPTEGESKYDEVLYNLTRELEGIKSDIKNLNLDSNLSILNSMKSILDRTVNDASFDSRGNKKAYLTAYGISNDPSVKLNLQDAFLGIRNLPSKYSTLKDYEFSVPREISISNQTTRQDLRRYLAVVNEAISMANLAKEYLDGLNLDSILQDLNCY